LFEQQLEEEKIYLNRLSKEPEVETDQMEYYQRLCFISPVLPCLLTPGEKFDVVCEEGSTAHWNSKCHARESYEKALEAVQEMERKMEIVTRWVPEGAKWRQAATLVSTRCYRLCVDKLELLVVKRLFELTKMNMSQTGESGFDIT
ncbi:hypothetical protein C8R44DRAFT_639760, partial [Mycena epipterygia]